MLSDPIFMIETVEGRVCADFPTCLARLSDGSLRDFQGMAAHQRPAWRLFLYQVAALALVRSNEAVRIETEAGWQSLHDPAAWRDWLTALAPSAAWDLVNPDLARPGLLQPPIGSASLSQYKVLAETADELDVLVTSKNHDVKMARAVAADPCHWLFALVNLQTMQGYSGRGNFGIARMNGGFASRPLVERVPDRTWGGAFRRGVQAALAARRAALALQPSLYRADGHALLWLQDWDQELALPLSSIEPLGVEICRRVRLRRGADGNIVAYGRPSETARLNAPKELKGGLGDAWTPVNATDNAALTVGGGGFDYRLVSRLLNKSHFTRPIAAQTTDPWLHLAVLVRGQGKTEGYHERWVRLPDGVDSDKIGEISEVMVYEAKEAKKALSMALLTLLQGGPDAVKFDDNRPAAWLDAADQEIDAIFFDHLRTRALATDDHAVQAHQDWQEGLFKVVKDLFVRATNEISSPGLRRERAVANAAVRFFGLLGKAQLLPVRTSVETEEAPHETTA